MKLCAENLNDAKIVASNLVVTYVIVCLQLQCISQDTITSVVAALLTVVVCLELLLLASNSAVRVRQHHLDTCEIQSIGYVIPLVSVFLYSRKELVLPRISTVVVSLKKKN
jgi:hypothetical protein